jgi:hypothetical protein
MGIEFINYGQARERIATESELEIFEVLRSITGREDLDLVRKSDNYVSAVIGDWDLARFKYTPRAKWIQFPFEAKPPKHKIETPADVADLSDLVMKSLEHILKYV